MQTNFFNHIASLDFAGSLRMVIQRQENKLLVGVLLVGDNINDKAAKLVPSMNFEGTPAELDEGFFTALATPLEKTSQLFTNMDAYAKALEETQRQSKMAKEQEDKYKNEKNDRKKKYDTALKRVDELEAQKKYGEAIGAMPKAEQFPEQAAEINSRLVSLRSKHGQLNF